MKKLLALGAGSLAAVTMALISAGQAASQGPVDVSGETYAKAVALLKEQGYKAVFGGSVGSDVPESQCIVSSEKMLSKTRVSLELNCTKAAQPPAGSNVPSGAPRPPTVGSNGVTTVTPTPVGPQPGMSIPGT